MRVGLIIEYEGTRYNGFQLQTNGPSVQGEIEQGLKQLTGKHIRIYGAGRTDSGVHALGQVVAFDTNSEIPLARFITGLNFYLPDDIAVKSAHKVNNDFNPRHEAQSRKYRYTILNSLTRSPLDRRFTYLVNKRLNYEIMNQAAKKLIGTRDFAPFSGPLQKEGVKTVRTIYCSGVVHLGTKILFEIRGSSFLPQQVRRIVGTLLKLGQGKMLLDEFLDIANSTFRGAAVNLVPPHGLCLVEVTYANFPPRLEN